MRTAYAEDPALTDGLTRIAAEYWRARLHSKALGFSWEDYRAGRQSPGWTATFAGWLLDAGMAEDATGLLEGLAPDALPTASHRCGYALSKARLGRFDGAEAAIRMAYAEDPALRDGLSRLGWEWKGRGELARAAALLEEDRRFSRQSPAWRVNYATVLLDTANADAATALLAETPFDELLSDDVRHAYLSALLRLGRFDEAEALVRRSYADPNCGLRDGLSRVARAHCDAGRRHAALALWREDRDAGRQNAGGAALWAACLLDAGETAAARTVVETLPSVTLTSIADRYNYAVTLGRLGRVSEAESRMREVYAGDAQARDGLSAIADGCVAAGNRDHAVELLCEDAASRRQSAYWAAYAANLLVAMSEPARAVEALEAHDHSKSQGTARLRYDLVRGVVGSSADRRRLWPAGQAMGSPGLPDERLCLEVVNEILATCGRSTEPYVAYMLGNCERVRHDAALLAALLSGHASFLDIGGVPPLLAGILRRTTQATITIADPHADRFDAYCHAAGVAAFTADVLSVAEIPQQYDVVAFCEVLEHLTGNILEALTNCLAMVRPGGYLLVTTPNLRSFSGLVALLRYRSALASKPLESVAQQYARAHGPLGFYGHLREYTAHEVIGLMEGLGLRLVRQAGQPNYLARTGPQRLAARAERFASSWALFGKYLFRKPAATAGPVDGTTR
jgi:thioredoxin-like negative regulator of GroEL